MTEAEWLACTEPDLLLVYLHGKGSERKLRLLCCACVRRIWYRLAQSETSRRAVELAEKYADGDVTQQEMLASVVEAERAVRSASKHKDRNARQAAAWCVSEKIDALSITRSVAWAATYGSRKVKNVERSAQLHLIREIFCPFGPVAADPSWLGWNGGTLVKLAQTIYADRAFDRLSVLADALEDAGCHDADMLVHCRQQGEHVRGCWVVDLLLGKE